MKVEEDNAQNNAGVVGQKRNEGKLNLHFQKLQTKRGYTGGMRK